MTAPLYIDGIAFWSPTLPGWDLARQVLQGQAEPQQPPAKRPSPQMLAPAERRRAPDTVALALEVAAAACADAARDPATLPSLFVSAHGDLAINDNMCSTLASNPTLMSPTRFHNSVHNAAAGYWTMAAACHQASTALTAFEWSFANGLLAAATQCQADEQAVLLVGYDIEAVGALASVTRSSGLLAMALVLSPVATGRSLARLGWALAPGGGAATPLRHDAARALAGNAMADALPLAEALAQALQHGTEQSLALPLSPHQHLLLQLDDIRPHRTTTP